MKSVIYLLMILIGLSTLSFASINPQLQLYNYSINETPAVPGDTVLLTLHIRNIEFANCADTISVQLVTSYPLSVNGVDTQYIDSLCLNDPDSKGTVTFTLPVDSLAQSGTYPVTIVTNYEKEFDKFSTTNTLNVHVLGVPSVSASVTSSNPSDFYPGDKGSVTVTFQNNGTGKIQSGHVVFSAPQGIDVKWAGQGQDIGQIPAHGSASVTFNVEALKNATSGNYPITAVLDYTGDNTATATQDFTFIMPVKDKADFVASATDGTTLNADEDRQVQITLQNTGTQEARKVRVRISPVFPFSTDGTERYIDSLAPGQSQSLDYLVHVDKDATPGQQVSGVIIDYEDPQGNAFTDTEYFAMNVKTKTLIDQILAYWYVFVVVFLLIAFIIVRRILKFVGKLWRESGQKK